MKKRNFNESRLANVKKCHNTFYWGERSGTDDGKRLNTIARNKFAVDECHYRLPAILLRPRICSRLYERLPQRRWTASHHSQSYKSRDNGDLPMKTAVYSSRTDGGIIFLTKNQMKVSIRCRTSQAT